MKKKKKQECMPDIKKKKPKIKQNKNIPKLDKHETKQHKKKKRSKWIYKS